jgi:hypothetical protein
MTLDRVASVWCCDFRTRALMADLTLESTRHMKESLRLESIITGAFSTSERFRITGRAKFLDAASSIDEDSSDREAVLLCLSRSDGIEQTFSSPVTLVEMKRGMVAADSVSRTSRPSPLNVTAEDKREATLPTIRSSRGDSEVIFNLLLTAVVWYQILCRQSDRNNKPFPQADCLVRANCGFVWQKTTSIETRCFKMELQQQHLLQRRSSKWLALCPT